MDLEPDSSQESVQYRLISLRQIMPNVIRDLENLLNTRCSPLDLHSGFRHLAGSLINYGLKDFSSENPSSSKIRQELCREIEKKIRWFEPRLKNVSVSVETQGSRKAKAVFRISGILKIEPIAEPVYFDTFFDNDRGQYVVNS